LQRHTSTKVEEKEGSGVVDESRPICSFRENISPFLRLSQGKAVPLQPMFQPIKF